MAIGLVCLLAMLVTAIAATQTSWFRNWVRGYVERQAGQYLNGDVHVGRIHGNLLFGARVDGMRVSMDGRDVAALGNITLDYNALSFISHGVSIDRIGIASPEVHV